MDGEMRKRPVPPNNTGKRYAREKKRIERFDKDGRIQSFTERGGMVLLREAASRLNAVPQEGLVMTKVLQDEFRRHWRKGRAQTKRQEAQCSLNMSYFLESFGHRALGKPERAMGVLADREQHINGCWACQAEHRRFLAAINKDMGKLDVAIQNIQESLRLYEGSRSPGHNLAGNGLGSSLFLLAHIQHTADDNKAAICTALGAIELLRATKSTAPGLYLKAEGNLAVYYFFDDQPEQAAPHLAIIGREYDTTQITITSMMYAWLQGLILARGEILSRDPKGRRFSKAEELLVSSMAIAEAIGSFTELTMIGADLLALCYLTGCTRWQIEKALDLIPGSMSSLAQIREAIRHQNSADSVLRMIGNLRQSHGSKGKILPCVLYGT